MVEGNGGLTTGERLTRIEAHIERIDERLDARITAHRERNEQAVELLGKSILNKVSELEPRIARLETDDATDKAVERYKRWLFGGVAFLVLNVVLSVVTLVQNA